MGEDFKDAEGKWDLGKIVKQCETELVRIGILLRGIEDVKMCRDRYLSGRLGEEWNDKFVLYISQIYRNPKYGLEEVKTIICHQLLHSAEGCMNHGRLWEEYAKKVEDEYGYRILAQAGVHKPAVNWDAGCGKENMKNDEKCCYIYYTEKLMGILEECSEELRKVEIETGRVSEIRFLRRDSVYGWCRDNDDGTYTILVSHKCGMGDADRFGLKGLICHELLHTCPDDDSNPYTGVHGPKWREMARQVERAYGYRIMGQSHTDTVCRVAGPILARYICPNCGGYYDIYNEKDREGSSEIGRPSCKWCGHKTNRIHSDDTGTLASIYLMFGECRDKLRIAGIPIGRVSGIGFAWGNVHGIHDNWDGAYSVDLPEEYRQRCDVASGLREYLYRELIRTCDGCMDCGQQWAEYVRRAEAALGFPIILE